MARKYGKVERILMHLQNAPIYHAKYKNEESLGTNKRKSADVITTEEKKVNMRRNVTLEHCFGGEKTPR